MEELIQDIFKIIKDYRSDENSEDVKITPNRINRWINQFKENDKVFILSELKHIFEQRYCTKKDVEEILSNAIENLCEYYEYENCINFLEESIFLDLQRPEKSQPRLLTMMKSILEERYDFNLDNCGSSKMKNCIYIDDVLCTGNTLFQDINGWVNKTHSNGETFLKKLLSKEIRLIILYIFIHEMNFYKKDSQFRHRISKNFTNCYQLFRVNEVENKIGTKLDLIFPSEECQPELVKEYQRTIIESVNSYCKRKEIIESTNEFYRPSDQPMEEEFFSSKENRKRFEDIILHKGIEILNNADTNIPNLRALGYSLPSLKNFGFGALCFTWRNIPNNCPLVFWYSGGGFFPLFVKHQT